MKYKVLKFDHHVWLEKWLNEHENFTIISINTKDNYFYLTVLMNKADNNARDFKQIDMSVVRTPAVSDKNNQRRPFVSRLSQVW